MGSLHLLRRLVLPLFATAALAGCSTTTATDATDGGVAFCVAWKSISWSTRDTPQTIEEVKANNAARVGWGCPDPNAPS